MAWYEDGYFGFDTETTGVTESSDRIVSAAIVRYNSKHEVIHTLQWLINPGIEIPAAATAVNGISTEQVQAHGAPARAAINDILHVIADFSATMPLVAFNGSFDLTVLYHEAQRNGLTGSAEFARIFAPESPLALIDGLTMHRRARPVWHGRRNLGALCKVYGVELGDNAHSAFHDARACAELSVMLTHEHPELFEVPAAELHQAQMSWYPAQMEELEAYLRRSREDETITCAREWPVRK